MTDSEMEDALQCWPGDWPGRLVVDLDNLGDPGIWLEERMLDTEEALSGNEEAIKETAAFLAEEYSNAAAKNSFPVPSDFECSEQEELHVVTHDFCGLLLEWHRRYKSLKETKG